MTHEVTYGTLPAEVRAELHGHFAGWLEAQSRGAGGPPPVDLLAYHYSRSDHAEKACEYLRYAGEAAATTGAASVAADCYAAALVRLAPDAPQRGAVLVALGGVLEQTSAWEPAAARYHEALDWAAGAEQPAVAAAAARGLGVVRTKQGTYAEAIRWLEEAQSAYAQLADAPGEARVLAELGRVYQLQGAYVEAQRVLAESQARAKASGAPKIQALALAYRGGLAWWQGDHAAAERLFAESLALRRDLGDGPGIAACLNNLGTVAAVQGDYPTARALHTESLALRRDLGDRWGIAGSLNNLGLLAHAQDDYGTARRLLEESLALRRELGDRQGIAQALGNLGLVALADGTSTAMRPRLGAALRICQVLGPGPTTRDVLVAAAGLLAPTPAAAAVLGFVHGLLQAPLDAIDQRVYDQAAAATRAALGDPAYTAAVEAGRALVWEAAFALALAALADS